MVSGATPIDARLREQREATLSRLLEAQNRSDIEGALDTFTHPRIELVGAERTFDGAEEVTSYLRESRLAFPDQHFELISIHHADEAVICELWMSGTHRGEIHGFEPTFRRFRAKVASFFLFRGAGLTCQRVYYDARSIVRQLA